MNDIYILAMTIIVTGANGFVGTRFIQYNQNKYRLIPVSLRNTGPTDIDLTDVDAIVHLAVVAHDFRKVNHDIQFAVNYDLTKQLADYAKKMKVPHFIFISTAKVYGDVSKEVLDESSPCFPIDAYGKSKLKAELYLQSIQSDNFKVAIIRPPLIYGPEVKGNMLRILRLADKNLPLPFRNTNNQRSLVFIDNLVELLNRIIDHKESGIFIAGDAKPVSMERLVVMIRSAMNKKIRMIGLPLFIKKIIKNAIPFLFNRLFGSFVIDNSNTNIVLNFTPPYSTEFGIRQMVQWYLRAYKK